MNVFYKLKVKIVGEYLLNQIVKLSKTDTPTDYVRVEKIDSKNNKGISIVVKFGSNPELLNCGFLKYYKLSFEEESKKYSQMYPGYTASLKGIYEKYKSRPTGKCLRHLKGIVSRFNKDEKASNRKFYLDLYDYIQNHSETVNIKESKTEYFTARNITISSMINGCKITVKSY